MPTYKRTYHYDKDTKPDRVVWCYKFEEDGERYCECGFETQRDAKNAELKRHTELHSKRNRPVAAADVAFEHFLPSFLQHHNLTHAPGTFTRDGRRIRRALDFFGGKVLSGITRGEILDYRDERKKAGLENRSINLELTLLRGLFGYAVDKKFCTENPAIEVKNLIEIREEHWIPTKEELVRFADAARQTSSGVVLAPWIWYMAYTGPRPGESLKAEWSKDIAFDEGRVRVFNSKPNGQSKSRYRYVEMHPELKPILLEWRQNWLQVFEQRARRHPEEQSPPHDWVFFNPHKQKSRAQSFYKCFNEARNKVGLPAMTPHTLRHFFISQAVMSGIDFFTIARWVGHRNTRMIEEVYGHLSPDHRRKQMAKLGVVPEAHTLDVAD